MILLISILSSLFLTFSVAQRMGNQAEMDRLELQANDLATQNDPEGAALAIGKAAMMADQLTKDSQEPGVARLFHGAAHHFRGQELGLRALALFERTGGHPPAPAGVCHYLLQGQQKLQQTKQLLEEASVIHNIELQIRKKAYLEKNAEWKNLFLGLQQDFECPNTINKK